MAPRPPYLAVVQRGNWKVFRFLQEHFVDAGLVEIVWDRRVTARRVAREPCASERRRGERRRPASPTWRVLGFVLIRRDRADMT